jgi:hypothetical protein
MIADLLNVRKNYIRITEQQITMKIGTICNNVSLKSP